MYKELARMHQSEGLDFSGVATFNLDEYYGLDGSHPHSYRCFMDANLVDGTNINRENMFIPNGKVAIKDVEAHCAEYEEKIKEAGGIDLQVLGIGETGILPSMNRASLASRTRLVALNEQTIKDNARFFCKR